MKKEFRYGEPIEYKMSKAAANYYLGDRKGDDKKLHPDQYLCKVVNETFGLKGNCIHVIVD